MSFFENFLKPKTDITTSDSSDINKVINEAILLDNLGDSSESMNEFYTNIGPAFAKRDGLLFEKPVLRCEKHSGIANKATVLMLAKQANDPDFDAYIRLCSAKKAYFNKLVEKYGERAVAKIEDNTNKLNNNDRVVDAMNKTIGQDIIIAPTPEGCCK